MSHSYIIYTDKEIAEMTDVNDIDKKIEDLKKILKQKKYMGHEKAMLNNQIAALMRRKMQLQEEGPKVVPAVTDETIGARKAIDKTKTRTSSNMSIRVII